MRVQMTTTISGGRGDGSDWPPAGGFLVTGDAEALDLIRGRLAVPAPEPEAPFETADAPVAGVELRGEELPAPDGVPGDDGAPAEGDGPGGPGIRSTKQEWVDHAVASGCDPAEAAAMTKADLAARYGQS